MIISLTASITGQGRIHQIRAQPVLKVALEHAFFDENRPSRRITLIIHVERPAPEWNCPVVHHRAQFGCDALTDQVSECGGLLPIEIRFQTVADRFV